jgi:4-hydroxybenzoyl-CoA thioesterase
MERLMDTLPPVPAAAFRTPAPVRFSHCDPAGIVYFAAWFDLANGAIEDLFNQRLGVAYADMLLRRRLGFGYVDAQATFRVPAMMGDILHFVPLVERIGTSSCTFRLLALKREQLAAAFRLVCVQTDLAAHRPIPIAEDVRAALATYQETCA